MSLIDLKTLQGHAWAVGVSGGADSVALLLLLKELPDLKLRVVHLDHELRGPQSAQDAEFVQSLCEQLNVPCHVARRSEIEPTMTNLPRNAPARYRELRLALFRHVVAEDQLHGVLLAHHADDMAETVLQRLIRGGSPDGLAAMANLSIISGLRIVRPLLYVRRQALRDYLIARGQTWREDESNANPKYLRNRLRAILNHFPDLTAALLDLAAACRELKTWTSQTATRLPPVFGVSELSSMPPLLARRAAKRWLIAAGAGPQELTRSVLDRLLEMAADAATPAAQQFPGKLLVRRSKKQIRATPVFRSS